MLPIALTALTDRAHPISMTGTVDVRHSPSAGSREVFAWGKPFGHPAQDVDS